MNACDERLLVRLSSSEAVEADLVVGQVDFDAEETMYPERINLESGQEDLDGAGFVGAAQEDDGSPERALEIQFPFLRKGTTNRSGVETWCGPDSSSSDKTIRPLDEVLEIVVLKACPDLGLPTTVVALNGGLEAGLFMRREDRCHAQLQTEPSDAAEGVAIDPIALEDGVVVELGILGQTVLTPVINERFDRECGPPGRAHPAAAETSMETDAVEDHDVGAAADHEAFHEIEAVQFGLTTGDARQIPAFGRRGPANSYASVESTAAAEDPTNGPRGGDPFNAASQKFAMNGSGAKFTEIAEQLELRSDAEDQVLDALRGGPGGSSSAARGIREVDAVESLSSRPSYPFLNRCQRHPKLLRHSPHRPPPLHRSHHSLPPQFDRVLFESQCSPSFQEFFRSIVTTIGRHSSDHL